MIEKNVRFTTKTDFFSIVQIRRLVIWEPVGVQRRYVPHFKAITVLYLDLRSSRAWHQFYLPLHPEKVHRL